MGLRFDPVGGGQFKQIVNQIIEADSQPIKSLNQRKAKEEARLKLFQEFKTKFINLDHILTEMTGFRKFRELKSDLGDGANLISVSLDKDHAEPGTYQIEIDGLAKRTSAVSNGVENPDARTLGMGFVTIYDSDGGTTEVYVDEDSGSLKGLAAAINHEEDAPVRASVIKDSSDPDSPYKLLLTAKKDGEANQFDAPDFIFPDADDELSIEDENEANNARIIVDGFPIELEGNDVNDFLPGVSIHLKQARPDEPFTLTITEDYQKITGKLKSVIDQINPILSFISKQNTVDEHTDTSTTFAGDTSLQTIEFRLRNALHDPLTLPPNGKDDQPRLYLNQLGIEFDKQGQVLLKEDRFDAALQKNFDAIAYAIAGEDGLVTRLRNLCDAISRPSDGTIGVKERAMRSRIRELDNQIDEKTRLVERKKQDLVAKYARLEGTLGNLQKQQQYISSVLPSAPAGSMTQLLGA